MAVDVIRKIRETRPVTLGFLGGGKAAAKKREPEPEPRVSTIDAPLPSLLEEEEEEEEEDELSPAMMSPEQMAALAAEMVPEEPEDQAPPKEEPKPAPQPKRAAKPKKRPPPSSKPKRRTPHKIPGSFAFLGLRAYCLDRQET